MKVRISGAIIAYTLMLLAIFTLSAPLGKHKPLKYSFLYGGILGLCLYGVYNATNYATFTNYSIEYAVTDTMWGVLIMGSMTALANYVS